MEVMVNKQYDINIKVIGITIAFIIVPLKLLHDIYKIPVSGTE